MLIGIYDADFVSKPYYYPINYDLLKIANYHQSNKDLVKFITDPSTFNKYSKVYYRKDIADGKFDNELILCDNIDYGGRAFTGGIYKPLESKFLQYKPDGFISTTITQQPETFFQTRICRKNKTCAHVMLREYAKDKESSLFVLPASVSFAIHDENIFEIPNWDEMIQEIAYPNNGYYKKHSLWFKMDQQINNFSILTQILKYGIGVYGSGRFYYYKILDDSQIRQYAKLSSNTLSDMIYFCIGNKNSTYKEKEYELVQAVKLGSVGKIRERVTKFFYIGDYKDDYLFDFYDALARWGTSHKRINFKDYIVNTSFMNKKIPYFRKILDEYPAIKKWMKIDTEKFGGEWINERY